MSGAAPGAQASTTPTPTPSPTAPATAPSVLAAPLGGGILEAGATLAVSVGVSAGATDIPAAGVTVAIGTNPLTSADQIDDWIARPRASEAPTSIGSATVTTIPAQSREVAVIRADSAAVPTAPGVYPILATATVAGITLTSGSVFVVPGAQQTAAAVIVPITAPALSTALLDAAQLATLTAPEGALTAVLDGVQGTAAILAIDPAIPAAIRALGTAAPVSATDWLAKLDDLPNSRFALQFGDADPAAQAAAGIAPPLSPLELTALLDPASFSPNPAPSGTPTPTATGAPTLEELLEVSPAATPVVYWPEAVTGETLAQLGADGATVVISSDAARAEEAFARGAVGQVSVLVADAGLSEAYSAAASATDSLPRAAALAQAAGMQQLAVSAAGGPVLVALTRDSEREAASVRAAVDGALSYPGVTSWGMPALLTAPATALEIVDQPLDQARIDAIPALLAGEREITAFATVLDDPTVLTGRERAEILQLLGLGWSANTAGWTEALAAHHAQTATTVDSVDILPTVPIQQVSSGSDIPVWIRNDLPYPVTVIVHARPDDLRLEVAESTQVSVGPSQSLRATLAVQSRIGSGTVHMDLFLTSDTGVRVGDGQQLEINVRADWETIGLVILAILGGGFLTVGIIRTVLRLRRRNAPPEDAS